jgi:membrane protein implicated in regulation of membrane protease activity
LDGSPETWRWIWLAAAVGFAVGEIAVAGTFFLAPFAVGAAVAAAAAFAGAGIGIEWLLFVAVSGAAASVLVPLGRRLDQRTGHHAIGSNRWVGQQALVLKEIPAGHGGAGLVRLEREEWRAESLMGSRIAVGSTVLVSRVDGTRLVVVPIEEPSELEGG